MERNEKKSLENKRIRRRGEHQRKRRREKRDAPPLQAACLVHVFRKYQRVSKESGERGGGSANPTEK